MFTLSARRICLSVELKAGNQEHGRRINDICEPKPDRAARSRAVLRLSVSRRAVPSQATPEATPSRATAGQATRRAAVSEGIPEGRAHKPKQLELHHCVPCVTRPRHKPNHYKTR